MGPATYRVLRAAAELRIFTIPELSRKAGCPEASTRTVLARYARLFSSRPNPHAARQRGGVQRLYSITRVAELEDTLARGLSEFGLDEGTLNALNEKKERRR